MDPRRRQENPIEDQEPGEIDAAIPQAAIAVDYPIDEIIVPPPIRRVIRAFNSNNINIPGEIVIAPEGQLLAKTFEYEGFVGDLLESYDNWISHRLPQQIASRPIMLPSGDYVRVTHIHLSKPALPTSTNETIPLYPKIARDDGRSYVSYLYGDLTRYTKDGRAVETTPMLFFGKIPVMLGSVLCHLHGKTEAERLNMGECSKDPLGYFIIKGTERVILIQEKLRLNRIMMYNQDSKGNPIVKITCSAINGTKVVRLKRSDDGGIRISLYFLGKDNTLSVFQIFRLLGITESDQMLSMVLVFVRDEWKKKVMHMLHQSFIEYIMAGDDLQNIAKLKGIERITMEEVLQMLKRDLFPHMRDSDDQKRLFLLAIMIARYAEFMAGLRGLDDRDSWANKRLESAGRMLEQLFEGLWNVMIDQTEEALKKQTRAEFKLDQVRRAIAPSVRGLSDQFISAFSSNNWGIKTSPYKENVTDVLKRDAPVSVFSHMTRINTPTNRQAKQPNIRMVQMSQRGYIDVVETPEGEGCGLVKNKATTCYVSVERDPTIINEYIRPYITDNPTESNLTVCILNGKFLGWCNGPALRDYLIEKRRSLAVHKDTAIVLDDDNILNVYTDGARPTRPLLIVDPDGQLVIRKKGLWVEGRPVPEMPKLLEEGAVEYLDVYEETVQSCVLVAQSINDLDMVKREIAEANSRREQLLFQFNELTGRYLGPVLSPEDKAFLQKYIPHKEFLLTEETVARFLPHRVGVVDVSPGETLYIELERLEDPEIRELYERTVQSLRQQLNVIEVKISDLTTRRRKPYTHCELDPNSMLGIAASMIPLLNHNQAPRNVYQCLVEDELIMCPDNTVKMIKDLQNGDQVLTINPSTLQVTTTHIKNHFTIKPREHGKKVYEIVTKSGRRIKATGDHPFLTQKGFVRLDHLKPSTHQLLIYSPSS